MKAAVVDSYDRPPRYGEVDEPVAREHDLAVTVRAAALSQLVRLQAAGRHYTKATLPFVPGADGVGELDDGRRVYFLFPRPPVGAMAERVVVDRHNVVEIPDDIGDVIAAAMANPGMSSLAALRERAGFVPGEAVLINGAAGVSGRLAIQIARYLGAGRVVATARKRAVEDELRALGADAFVALDGDTETLVARLRDEMAAGVDVVLDYLSGSSAEAILAACSSRLAGPSTRGLRVVNIGSLGGPTITVPVATLRSARVEIMGSGIGSVTTPTLVQIVGEVLRLASTAGLRVDTRSFPLADVEAAWTADGASRTVFTI